jgi:crossover junction endodeoxyribonuclease RuvC
MRALGVDPGTALLGYGVVTISAAPQVVEFGALATSPRQRMAERLRELYEGLDAVIRRSAPQVLAVEQLFFARNVTTALAVGQARGIVLLLAAQHNLDIFEYKPNEVKLAVAGYGGADKSQMQEMVRLQLELTEVPQPDDAADALALALCHVFSQRFHDFARQGTTA